MSNSKESKVETSPWSSLPDDVALNCIARLSRLDRAALSLVSKSYRALVASPDLDKTRSLMGYTETCVYVCLRPPPPDTNPRWYMLRRTKTSHLLIPIPSLPSQPPEAFSVAVLDSGIYVIGGLREGSTRTSDVWLLDCRTHTWHTVPSMRVARANAVSGVLDGKIYVFGGCRKDSLSYGEVFDPKTQAWDSLPLLKVFHKNLLLCDSVVWDQKDSVVWDQKVYALGGKDKPLYYSPSQGDWGIGNRSKLPSLNWCMVGNFLCCINIKGAILWSEPEELARHEPEVLETKEVKGLEFLKDRLSLSRLVHFDQPLVNIWDRIKRRTEHLMDLLPGFRLSSSGGNIVLYWDVIEGSRLEIWCAEISLERQCQGGETWGNVEWMNVVMTVDPFLDHYKVLYTASIVI